jgi:Fe2+ or Zn2+ uptake regulation protein
VTLQIPTTRGAEDRPIDLRAALEAAGHRHTQQRAAVFAVLRNDPTHPTADELCQAVRECVPEISLATVYNALEAFEAAGVCARLAHNGGPARYDGRIDAHDHLECVVCGSLVDVEGLGARGWLSGLEKREDVRVLDYRLTLVGYCAECAPREEQA